MGEIERLGVQAFRQGASPLHGDDCGLAVACSNLQHHAFRIFLQAQEQDSLRKLMFEVTSETEKGSLLHLAVEHNNYYAIEKLLEAGWDINLLAPGGKTCLFYINNSKMLQFLVDQGANVGLADAAGNNCNLATNNIHDNNDRTEALRIIHKKMKGKGINNIINMLTLKGSIEKAQPRTIFEKIYRMADPACKAGPGAQELLGYALDSMFWDGRENAGSIAKWLMDVQKTSCIAPEGKSQSLLAKALLYGNSMSRLYRSRASKNLESLMVLLKKQIQEHPYLVEDEIFAQTLRKITEVALAKQKERQKSYYTHEPRLHDAFTMTIKTFLEGPAYQKSLKAGMQQEQPPAWLRELVAMRRQDWEAARQKHQAEIDEKKKEAGHGGHEAEAETFSPEGVHLPHETEKPYMDYLKLAGKSTRPEWLGEWLEQEVTIFLCLTLEKSSRMYGSQPNYFNEQHWQILMDFGKDGVVLPATAKTLLKHPLFTQTHRHEATTAYNTVRGGVEAMILKAIKPMQSKHGQTFKKL